MIDVPRLLQVLKIDAERRGQELWARCPHPGHEEKDSSWKIVDDPGGKWHGLSKCFGCGESGGPARLVASIKGVSCSTAQWWIEQKGLDGDRPVVLRVRVEVEQDDTRSFVLPPTVRGVGALAVWPRPFRRFADRRGLTDEQVARWGIGYAASGKLAYRVVFPIFDDSGRLLSYSARDITGEARAKYLTASRREGADPDAVFGAKHWPAPGWRQTVYVTEGVLNALAVERVVDGEAAGEGLGALDGSDLRPGQVIALSTFRRVVVLSDPDLAGDKLASAIATLGRWRELVRVGLPEGEDANSLSPRALISLLRAVPSERDPRDAPPRRRRRSEASARRRADEKPR